MDYFRYRIKDRGHINLTLQGALSEEERERVLQIANLCPVHRTLHNHLQVRTALAPKKDEVIQVNQGGSLANTTNGLPE